MPNNHEIDRLIERALASYSNAEPLSGLESRVLNRVRNEPSHRRSWLASGVACVAMVGIVCAIVLAIVTEPPRSAHQRGESHASGAQRPAIAPSHSARASVPALAPESGAIASVVRRTKLPRSRGTRPAGTALATTMQLSPDEQALLTLGRTEPELAEALARRQAPPANGNILIAPIEITPLPALVSE